jgi:hypothetical protein
VKEKIINLGKRDWDEGRVNIELLKKKSSLTSY